MLYNVYMAVVSGAALIFAVATITLPFRMDRKQRKGK